MNIEEQIKQFLDEEYEKYKNITDEENHNQTQRPYYNKQIHNDFESFMKPISNEIIKIDDETMLQLEHYTAKLGTEFKCKFLGQVFHHAFWFTFNMCPFDK